MPADQQVGADGPSPAIAPVGGSDNPAMVVVVVSVLRSDGTVLQARLEGELCGAVPRLGDYVSMWGGERHGVLIMGLGFNHSVNAEIRIQKR